MTRSGRHGECYPTARHTECHSWQSAVSGVSDHPVDPGAADRGDNGLPHRQEVLINENIIREGSATAESAEEIAKINVNKIGQSASEAEKMKADADSAESSVLINRNKVEQSVSEAAKMKADTDSAEASAKVNCNKIANAQSDMIYRKVNSG